MAAKRRKTTGKTATSPRRSSAGSRSSGASGRGAGSYQDYSSSQFSASRVGDLDRAIRENRLKKNTRKAVRGVVLAAILALALVGGAVALHWSNLFAIEQVTFTGVEHLTEQDLANLAALDENDTLLRLDSQALRESLLRDAWVKDVSLKRHFPDTLEIVIEEREIAALVIVPSPSGFGVQEWAIASDGVWLMPIPDQDSEAGQATSQQIYEDIESVLTITDVPYTTSPEIGAVCADSNVNNALNIVSSLTTELSDRVTSVKATDEHSTTLTIKDGPDIAFGNAEDIRDKERVCLAIMAEHPDGVSYINVSDVLRPTWRAL